jgi:hypothetical protein
MNRPAGVIIIAVLLILGGLMCLGMAGLMWFSFQMARSLPEIQAQPAALSAALQWISVGMFAGLAAWGLGTGIGLLVMKKWARVSAIVIGSMLVCFGVLGLPFLLMLPQQMPPGVDPSVMVFVRLMMVATYAIQIALGAWWWIYLTRPKVRAAFSGGVVEVAQGPQRPLSMTVIAWIFVTSAPFLLLGAYFRFPIPFLGMLLTEASAAVVWLVWATVGTIGSVLLLRNKRLGYWLILGYLGFGAVNAVICYSVPGLIQRANEIAFESWPPILKQQGAAFQPSPWTSIFPLVLTTGVPLYFLLTRRQAYFAACDSSSR